MTTAFAPDIVKELEEKTKGLFFLSETDSPFKVFSTKSQESFPEYLYTLSGRPSSDPSAEISLSYLFKNVTSLKEKQNQKEAENVGKYEDLMTFLIDAFKEIKVYKLGEDIHEDIFIVGTTGEGQNIILATKAVESI